jgi:hypothetical protein
MIDGLLGLLVPELGLTQGEGGSVTISIPKDHPKAEKLLELAETLATRQEYESGIVVDTGPNDLHVERVLDLLSEVVDVDALLERVAQESRLRAENPNLANIARKLMGTPLMGQMMNGEQQARLERILDDQKKTTP